MEEPGLDFEALRHLPPLLSSNLPEWSVLLILSPDFLLYLEVFTSTTRISKGKITKAKQVPSDTRKYEDIGYQRVQKNLQGSQGRRKASGIGRILVTAPHPS